MRFDVLSLFPEMFEGPFEHSIIKIARQKGLAEIRQWNIRDFTEDRHRSVDDRPFGGGPGMVMTPGPICKAVEHVQADADRPGRLVLLTPQGERLTQARVESLAREARVLLLCGRYEGVDDRVRLALKPLELSIGDYVLSGGELAAMVVVDAIVRLIPGVLGDADSASEESFSSEGWLEYPHYTRPREFRGMSVPEVLLSGNHAEIAAWRREQALERTRTRRAGSESPASEGSENHGCDQEV